MRPAPADDLIHQPDPAQERWRESYYFMFYDFELGIGCYSGIGYRPSKGYSGSAHVLWGDAMPTLVAAEFDRYEQHDSVHPVAGLAYRCVEPLKHWSLHFDGALNLAGSDPAVAPELVVPAGKDGAETVRVSYELAFETDQPPYLYREDPRWLGLFDGHIDEVARVTGVLQIGDRRFDVNGRGVKDHSWGARDWSRPKGWRWLDLVFEDGPQASLWRTTFDGQHWLQDGAIYHDGVAEPVTSYAEDVSFAPRPLAERPDRFRFAIASASHVIRGEAQVLTVVPLRFPIRDESGEKVTMWNDRTVFRCVTDDGRTGIGSAEFQFRLPADGSFVRPLLASDRP